MRFPWYIATLLSLLVFGGGLWFGARHHDFTIPPSDQDIENSLTAWRQKHSIPLPAGEMVDKKTEAEISTISTGNLTTTPALDHSTEHKDQAAQAPPDANIIEEESPKGE